MSGEIGNIHLRFFEFVDARVNLLQPARVFRAKIQRACFVGNLFQGCFINLTLLIHNLFAAKRIGHGNRHLSRFAHPNRVHFDAQRFCRVGGGLRINLSRVVHAIRQQDHDARFCIRIFDHVRRVCDAQANRGAVFDFQIGREFRIVQQPIQNGVVCRQRRLIERFFRKHHEPDAVIRALVNEIRNHAFRNFQTIVRLKIERCHAARNIERERNVNAFALDNFFCLDQLRTRESNNQ